ncbi:MAG: SAM-dependent methyltransferase [bacterium]
MKLGLDFNEVVLYGRNLYEYVRMFSLLLSEDIPKKIVDCAGGPSSFNSELTNLGGSIVSCDPIYALSKVKLEHKMNKTYKIIAKELAEKKENATVDEFNSYNNICNLRLSAMEIFFNDYEKGKSEKRYVDAELPNLAFDSQQFDIALCANFLFTYSHILTLEFHLDSIREMARIAKEVRIFPVFSISGKKSEYLDSVIKVLLKENYTAQLLTVDYEIIKGANQILIVSKS